MRKRVKDLDGAKADVALGLKLEPQNAKDWVSRGLAIYDADPEAARVAFDRAIRMDANAHEAYQNKAYFLSEKLGRDPESIEALNEAIDRYPTYRKALVGRTVLLARQGKRDAALADARKCEDLIRRHRADGETQYGIACIYALVADGNEEYIKMALSHLGSALAANFGQQHIRNDPDLNSLRADARFRMLVVASRALRPFRVERKGNETKD